MTLLQKNILIYDRAVEKFFVVSEIADIKAGSGQLNGNTIYQGWIQQRRRRGMDWTNFTIDNFMTKIYTVTIFLIIIKVNSFWMNIFEDKPNRMLWNSSNTIVYLWENHITFFEAIITFYTVRGSAYNFVLMVLKSSPFFKLIILHVVMSNVSKLVDEMWENEHNKSNMFS